MKPQDPVKRFHQNYVRVGDCWQWQGYLTHGYGHLSIGPRGEAVQVPAHRFSYELFVGPIPDNLEIDHLCRNRGCVNPEHLEPVTRKDNILRGRGLSAQNARRVTCPRGHGYDHVKPDGSRLCRECQNEQARERRRRAKCKTS